MIESAPLDVNVLHDWFDKTTLVAGLAGLAAAIAAIVIALRAQKSIPAERRRQFELEILADILVAVEETDLLDEVEFNPGKLRRYARRMQLIQHPPPPWVTIMTADWYAELVPEALRRQHEISARRFDVVKRLADDPEKESLRDEADRLQEELKTVSDEATVGVRGRLLNDLEEAIRTRVNAAG